MTDNQVRSLFISLIAISLGMFIFANIVQSSLRSIESVSERKGGKGFDSILNYLMLLAFSVAFIFALSGLSK